MPPSYVYGAPYLNTGSASTGLVPLQATQLSHAAAIAAATSQFYEYQNAVAAAASAPYPGMGGYDAYTYSPGTAAAVAGNGERVYNQGLSVTNNVCTLSLFFPKYSERGSRRIHHPVHLRCTAADGCKYNRGLSGTGTVSGFRRCFITRGTFAIRKELDTFSPKSWALRSPFYNIPKIPKIESHHICTKIERGHCSNLYDITEGKGKFSQSSNGRG